MVIDVIKTTSKNLKKLNPKKINDIYKQNYNIVNFSDNMQKIVFQIRKFLKIKMYNHKLVLKNTNKGKKIIKKLFDTIIKKPNKYILNNSKKNENTERLVCDFIAGMTDRYAINLEKKIS